MPDFFKSAPDKAHAALALALGETIQRFTLVQPMTAEDVIAVLCFTAGSAMAQKRAHSLHSTKTLRDLGVRNIDHGIQSAKSAASPIITLQ